MSSAAIETLGLAKRFGRIVGLADLTMTVERGEVFGFLGPNGAGKTTAVKLLLGLLRASSGAGEVLGAALGDREARRGIGYLPELFRYQDWLTAREVIAFHLRLIGVPRTRHAAAIDDVLELVALHERRGSRVGTFSKGMQQRLGLAVALAGRPELIVLDEPTSALDPVGRRNVRAIVEALRARGATVFLNSHLLTEVERVCDRVAFVDGGRIVAQGTVAEILGRPCGARVSLTEPNDGTRAVLDRFGPYDVEAPWYAFPSLERERVPRLVSELAAAGAQIHAVEPARTTLEDRFLQLVKTPDDDGNRSDHDS